MRESLSKRLFLITLGLLLGLMGLTLIFQTFIFSGFYEQKKINSLSKEVNKFKVFYSYNLNSDLAIASAFKRFENANTASIGLFSFDSTLKQLPDRVKNDPEERQILHDFCEYILKDNDILTKILYENKTYTTTFTAKETNENKIGVVSAMSMNSKNDTIIVTVSSVQPIQEAATVINELFVYIFIGVIFIAVILSSIYSNLITKPLLAINRVANKMCKMEFDERCVIDRQDEIGNLGSTLNFLSVNLQNALEDLRKKNKKLEADIEEERKLDAMRKDFIASVSHELKTPIGIIEGYAEGIKDGVVSGEDATFYLETIIDESKKMSYLVTNMLELSKLQSGVIKPNLEVFNINRLMKRIVSKHAFEADERDLNLIFSPLTDFSYVKADVFQMEQIFTNLITNCIKYTPPFNDIILSVKDTGETYTFSILNCGAEIPESDLEMIYTKFYRVDKSRHRKDNSTGLGLAIVREILEIYKSEYSIKNTDEGVLFSFTLPKENYEIQEEE